MWPMKVIKTHTNLLRVLKSVKDLVTMVPKENLCYKTYIMSGYICGCTKVSTTPTSYILHFNDHLSDTS
jgi:hypothetical protein